MRAPIAQPSPSFPCGQGVGGRGGMDVGSHGGKNFCPPDVGKNRQAPASSGKQSSLPLAFGVHRAAQNAPASVLRLIESEAQALSVSIRAGGHKLAYIAACIGRSEGYVSRLKAGKRPIPEKLVAPLCAATGSLLLAQFRALQEALDNSRRDDVSRIADLLRSAA